MAFLRRFNTIVFFFKDVSTFIFLNVFAYNYKAGKGKEEYAPGRGVE